MCATNQARTAMTLLNEQSCCAQESNLAESLPRASSYHCWACSAAKRWFDLSVSLAAVILTAPLAILVAIFIHLESQGPVLFRQKRVGRAGKLFDVLKFRTMTHSLRSGPTVTRHDDQRVTRLGRVLRDWKLD